MGTIAAFNKLLKQQANVGSIPRCRANRQFHRSGDLAGAIAVQLGAIRTIKTVVLQENRLDQRMLVLYAEASIFFWHLQLV